MGYGMMSSVSKMLEDLNWPTLQKRRHESSGGGSLLNQVGLFYRKENISMVKN